MRVLPDIADLLEVAHHTADVGSESITTIQGITLVAGHTRTTNLPWFNVASL